MWLNCSWHQSVWLIFFEATCVRFLKYFLRVSCMRHIIFLRKSLSRADFTEENVSAMTEQLSLTYIVVCLFFRVFYYHYYYRKIFYIKTNKLWITWAALYFPLLWHIPSAHSLFLSLCRSFSHAHSHLLVLVISQSLKISQIHLSLINWVPHVVLTCQPIKSLSISVHLTAEPAEFISVHYGPVTYFP